MSRSKTLYRNTRRGKFAGVCAGLADYFSVEVWLVRIITITAFLLTSGGFVFVLYVAAWLILDKKPFDEYESSNAYASSGTPSSGFTGKGYTNAGTNAEKVCVKSKVWQAGMPPKQAFLNIQQRYIRTENRLRKLESYVTSKEFQLSREINRL